VKGFTTIHASSARGALGRLRFLAELSDAGGLASSALSSLVSESVDLVVFSRRSTSGPRVMEIIAVEDQLTESAGTFTVTDLFRRSDVDAPLEWTGLLPHRLTARLAADGVRIGSVLR